MTREEKITAIYKEMANKELTFGCKARIYYTNYPNTADKYFWEITKYIEVISMGDSYIQDGERVEYKDIKDCFLKGWDYRVEVFEPTILHNYKTLFLKIIGHPVMIGDVMDWIGKKKFDVNARILGFGFEGGESMNDESKLWIIQNHYSRRMSSFWQDKRVAIDEQSDECIDYIYELINK